MQLRGNLKLSAGPFIIVLILMVLMYVIYMMYSLKNKVVVYYTRKTGQEIPKMVKLRDRHVEFDGLRFDVLPDRKTLIWKTILGIFGTWMVCYHFEWYSIYPRDPKIYNVPIKSPEANRAMNRAAANEAYHRSETNRDTAKKKSGFAAYLPWIIGIILVLGVIYMFYQQSLMTKDMMIMKGAIQDILVNAGK